MKVLICPSVGEKSYLSAQEVIATLVEELGTSGSPLLSKYGKVVLKLHNFCFLQGAHFLVLLSRYPYKKTKKKETITNSCLDNNGESPHPLFTLTAQERRSAAVLKSNFTTAEEEQYNILPFLASFDVVCTAKIYYYIYIVLYILLLLNYY